MIGRFLGDEPHIESILKNVRYGCVIGAIFVVNDKAGLSSSLKMGNVGFHARTDRSAHTKKMTTKSDFWTPTLCFNYIIVILPYLR
ncbi:MAG: hypothetical protein A2583_09245 [Bdellovibrionales bacterium RIFOXYD1_FULL_53_11]|nr:MAG: hypothetical protein A2583_09245 [Bdellovibrionales bacterium RIFOXYD1_FULL_53_11]